ncbi:MAG: hypothetical protein NTZ56_01665 [Acidobacteria bacterium]|nr:hypothetical protein [Acidobacteriota bacterium]
MIALVDRMKRAVSADPTPVLAAALLFLAAAFWTFYLGYDDRWTAISTIATIFTAFVVLWYTIETQRLRVATENMAAHGYRPAVIIRHNPTRTDMIQVVNVGVGPALDIRLESATFDADYDLVCTRISHLPATPNAGQHFGQLRPNNFNVVGGEFLVCDVPEICVTYSDLGGQRWQTVCKYDGGMFVPQFCRL